MSVPVIIVIEGYSNAISGINDTQGFVNVAEGYFNQPLRARGWSVNNTIVWRRSDSSISFITSVNGSSSDDLNLVARNFVRALPRTVTVTNIYIPFSDVTNIYGSQNNTGVITSTQTVSNDQVINNNNNQPKKDILTQIGEYLGFNKPNGLGKLGIEAAAGGAIALIAVLLIVSKSKE